MSRLPAPPVVAKGDALIEPHRGDDEGPVAHQPFDRARLQVTRLNGPLGEQPYRLLPIGVEVIFPTAPLLRELLGRQQPAAAPGVGSDECGPAEGLVT